MLRGRTTVLPVLLTAVFAGQAAAQAACEVNEDRPSQIGRAFLSITQAATAQEAGNWAQSATALKSAVKSVSDEKAASNALGQTMVTGKVLSLWLNHPDLPPQVTREYLGFATNGATPVDLVASVDSLFDVVEAAQPGCAASLLEWRRQRAWVGFLNGAIEQLNAGNLDSAVATANRANQLSESPYAYMVLGNVAHNRQNTDEALKYYQQTIDAATDSLFRDVREQTLVTLGNLAADVAESKSGPEKTDFARRAADAFGTVMKESPSSALAPQARAGLSRSLLLQGDTAAFKASLQAYIDNPTNFSYQDVLASAVAAGRAGQWAEAVKLFEGVLVSNPWNRDALYNVALGYHEIGAFEKMLPHVTKLVKVDPSNGENWRLFAYAYNGMSKAAKAAAAQRALNDSVVKYFEMAEKMPHQLQFTEFSNTPEKTTLSGMIENRGEAAKSYALTIEFLDKDGNVVGTREAAVADVAPKASGRFSVSIESAPSVIAFRYAPLPTN